MKALLFASLIASASAGPAPYNTIYAGVDNTTRNCNVMPGYSLTYFLDGAPPTPLLAAGAEVGPILWGQLTTALVAMADVNAIAQGTACSAGAFTGYAGTAPDWVRLGCAAGFAPTGTVQAVWGDVAVAQGASWLPATLPMFTGNATDLVNYDLATGSTFICAAVPTGCNVTCTTAAAGGTCATGFSTTVSTVALAGTFTPCATTSASSAASTLNGVAIAAANLAITYTCAATGDVFAIVCSSSACDIPATAFSAWASQNFGGFTSSATCNCVATDVRTITCATGDVSCPKQTTCCRACTKIGTREGRQNTLRNDALCAPGLTLAQTIECFRQAACAGVINPALDTCQISSGLNAAGAARQPVNLDFCPNCNDTSKKGLLGLLGLLGLIPLLCLSLLCCLLLLSIRRKKAEGDVHFATFDAGAQPLEHCAPVHSHFQTVHTQTHVGAPHIDSGFAHAGQIVY